MWILLLLVVSVHDSYSSDISIQVPVKTEKACKESAKNMTYGSKKDNYVVTAVCKKLY